MMQQTTVVSSSRMAYMILLAMELLHMLGQQLQMAQAAEPKQQAAVLPREIMAPIVVTYNLYLKCNKNKSKLYTNYNALHKNIIKL